MTTVSISTPKTIHDNFSDPVVEYRVLGAGELTLIAYVSKGYVEPRKRQIILTESGAVANVIGAFDGKEKDALNVTLDTIHQAPNTTARTEFRAVLADEARLEFRGMIKILPGAHGSQDFLQQDSLLLSDGARATAIPGLEIEADDVKASHGATARPISQDERWYLMSRGLTKTEAERMIVDGFLSDIKKRIDS